MGLNPLLVALAASVPIAAPPGANWYEKSFYLLHEDHHTVEAWEVGRDADPDETARLIGLSKPDVIQIHAKGNPGWTTYPTKIGHTPPKLARDVLAVWRDIARRDGYHFSVYYNIGRDGVIMKRRPEWNRVRADGKPVDRALCYHSGVAEGYLWPMLREIMQTYRPKGFWLDGSCFTVHVCYCKTCRERFKRERNLDPPRTPDAPGWLAYQEMQRQIYREFVRDTARRVHAIDPNCLVAVNWAYSLRMPERPDPGIAYLTGDIGNRVEGLSAEAHWYDSLGVPFDLMTQLNTLHERTNAKTGKPTCHMAPKPRCQIEQEMAIIIANGGRYFVWDNPTPESGLVPERLEYLGRVVAPFLRQRQRWCLGSTRLPDVSLLNHAAAHYALGDKTTVCFSKRDNRIEGAADLLARLHLNYEMVPDHRLHEQDVKSPLLIVEHPKVLTRRAVDDLITYVKNGGALLMTGMGITRDKRLQDVLGATSIVGPRKAERLICQRGEKVDAFDHWLFRVTPTTAKIVLSVKSADGSSHALLTRNTFGKGTAYYVAVPLLSHHGKQTTPMPLLRAVFEHVRPPIQRIVTTDAPDTVEVGLRRQANAYVLHLVNMAPGQRDVITRGRRRYTKIPAIPSVPPCRASVRLPTRPAAVQVQPGNRPLEKWRYASGRIDVYVPPFDLHQMIVMRMP